MKVGARHSYMRVWLPCSCSDYFSKAWKLNKDRARERERDAMCGIQSVIRDAMVPQGRGMAAPRRNINRVGRK